MFVKVSADGTVTLEDHDNFRAFKLVVDRQSGEARRHAQVRSPAPPSCPTTRPPGFSKRRCGSGPRSRRTQPGSRTCRRDDRKGQAARLDRRSSARRSRRTSSGRNARVWNSASSIISTATTCRSRDYYEQRLKVIEAFDRAGFYAYHVAEHHFTPLGMAPSPSVFLSAIAQRTKRLRFGTFVYALPVHHPLRVLEEICMLDHMSGGRLEIGFGRGSVPYEISYYGQNAEERQQIYAERLELILQGLHRQDAELERQVRPVRERADGDRAVAEAASAAVVRRAFARQRRARRPQGPAHGHQRHAGG